MYVISTLAGGYRKWARVIWKSSDFSYIWKGLRK